MPNGRSNAGIWLELIGHHMFNSYDLCEITTSDNIADMGSIDNDPNAWVWEMFF